MNTNTNSGDPVVELVFAILICATAVLIILGTIKRMSKHLTKFRITCLILYVIGVIYGFFFNDFFGLYYYSFPGVLKADTMLDWITKGHDYVDQRYRENERLIASLRFADAIIKNPDDPNINRGEIIDELRKVYDRLSKRIEEESCTIAKKEKRSDTLQFSFNFFYYLFYMHLHGIMISPLAFAYTFEFFMLIVVAIAFSNKLNKEKEKKWLQEFARREEEYRKSKAAGHLT